MELATFAGGCFWCMEAVFQRLKGVSNVISGYTGGSTENPDYHNIGDHAEGVQVTFDPAIISYEQLLDVFWHLHDPTTLNQQGNDSGTQYRSAIYYHDETQKKTAEESMKKAAESNMYDGKFVTEIKPFTKFYAAEDYHQDYFNKNSYQPYCQYVIDPKITKLYKEFKDLTKEKNH